MTDERMPAAEVYEQELKYMPYVKSLNKVIDIVCSEAPLNVNLVDYMCGTGYLLGKIAEKRPDLVLLGMDIDPRYIAFARQNHPKIQFAAGDVLNWKPENNFFVFTCTGALHHVSYDKQGAALRNMALSLHPRGFGIVSDCYIDVYVDELGRKLGAAKLGYEYLRETMQNGSNDEVTAVTLDIMKNDVMGIEFKTSVLQRQPVFRRHFYDFQTFKTWPDKQTEYGDYVTVLKRPIEVLNGGR